MDSAVVFWNSPPKIILVNLSLIIFECSLRSLTKFFLSNFTDRQSHWNIPSLSAVNYYYLMTGVRFSRLVVSRICLLTMQLERLWAEFYEIRWIGEVRTGKESSKFWKVKTSAGISVWIINSPVASWCDKWKWNWENQLRRSTGKWRRYALYQVPL